MHNFTTLCLATWGCQGHGHGHIITWSTVIAKTPPQQPAQPSPVAITGCRVEPKPKPKPETQAQYTGTMTLSFGYDAPHLHSFPLLLHMSCWCCMAWVGGGLWAFALNAIYANLGCLAAPKTVQAHGNQRNVLTGGAHNHPPPSSLGTFNTLAALKPTRLA